MGIFSFHCIRTPDEISDTKVRRVGTASNGATLGCKESSRQPSTICAKLGIPSTFPLPHLPSVPYTLREKRHRKNHPGVRSRKASNQREKISSTMAYKLKDRKEKMLYKGSVFTNSPCSGTERVSASAFAVCLLSMHTSARTAPTLHKLTAIPPGTISVWNPCTRFLKSRNG